MSDNIKEPKHYKSNNSGLQVIDVIEAFNCGFKDGNVVKYVLRYREKNGIEDLKKARQYLNRLINEIEKNNKGWEQ